MVIFCQIWSHWNLKPWLDYKLACQISFHTKPPNLIVSVMMMVQISLSKNKLLFLLISVEIQCPLFAFHVQEGREGLAKCILTQFWFKIGFKLKQVCLVASSFQFSFSQYLSFALFNPSIYSIEKLYLCFKTG